jgi:hypothetical protein
MSRLSVPTIASLSGAQISHLSRFVERVQNAVDSTRKSFRSDDPDRDMVMNSLVAALLLVAARLAARNYRTESKARLERAFLLSATEAIEIVTQEVDGASTLLH